MALFLACNVEKNLDFALSIFFSSWICLCTWQYSLRLLEHYRCCDITKPVSFVLVQLHKLILLQTIFFFLGWSSCFKIPINLNHSFKPRATTYFFITAPCLWGEETTLRWYSPVMQFASPCNSAFTCFTQFHRTPIDNIAMTIIIVTEARQLGRYDFLVILDHSGTCWTSSSAPLPDIFRSLSKHVLLRHLVKGYNTDKIPERFVRDTAGLLLHIASLRSNINRFDGYCQMSDPTWSDWYLS